MKRTFAVIVVASLLIPALGAITPTTIDMKVFKHAAQYQVATLDQNLRADTTTAQRKKIGGSGGVHLLYTAKGTYRIDAPVATFQSLDSNGQGFAQNLSSGVNTNAAQEQATANNGWFMDAVQPGTKVLFASDCSKPSKNHPNSAVRCQLWFPDNSAAHEYSIAGNFTPLI